MISPLLLANIALSVLDEHFCEKWDAHGTSWRREAHRKRGGATYGRVRCADDFVIMVVGTKAHADGLWDEVAQVSAPLGLRLSIEKSRVCHPGEGFDFLGFRIQRRRRKGTNKHASTPTDRRRPFLDDYDSVLRRDGVSEAARVFPDEPALTGHSGLDAAYAALACWLADRDGWEAPGWARDPDRVARPWWFVSDSAYGRAWALAQSPVEFRIRGVFITDTGLARV